MTSSRGGMAKMTGDDGGGGRGSENPEFIMTSFVNAPLLEIKGIVLDCAINTRFYNCSYYSKL